jgi:hypothetical protein
MEKVKCTHCGKEFTKRGINRHETNCLDRLYRERDYNNCYYFLGGHCMRSGMPDPCFPEFCDYDVMDDPELFED